MAEHNNTADGISSVDIPVRAPATAHPTRRRSKGAVTPSAWMTVARAAEILDLPVTTLRRSFDRNAKRGEGGAVVAQIDGVVARKFGRVWRVWLDAHWMSPTGR
jgi:hypothetical protein